SSPRIVSRSGASNISFCKCATFSHADDRPKQSRYNICIATASQSSAARRKAYLGDKPESGSSGHFCPVAMAAEIICSRWTVLVMRELLCGTTRFNDIRRGVPRMSPTLLSKRLRELAEAGVVTTKRPAGGVTEYRLTAAGEDMREVIMAMGVWGQ